MKTDEQIIERMGNALTKFNALEPKRRELLRAFHTVTSPKTPTKALNWAHNSAEFGIDMIINQPASDQDLKIQAMYVRSNLNSWRGEEARETKKALDKFIEEVHSR